MPRMLARFGLGGKGGERYHMSFDCKLPPRMKAKPSLALVLVLISGLFAARASFGDTWVTAQEVAQETEFAAHRPPPRQRTRSLAVADPEAPQIEVLRPNPLNGLKPPFAVELRFSARAGAEIDPGSLRVAYGFLGIDLTERIRKSATVTAEGLRADGVDIPRGDHRLTVRIADVRGRVGEREIRLSVGD